MKKNLGKVNYDVVSEKYKEIDTVEEFFKKYLLLKDPYMKEICIEGVLKDGTSKEITCRPDDKFSNLFDKAIIGFRHFSIVSETSFYFGHLGHGIYDGLYYDDALEVLIEEVSISLRSLSDNRKRIGKAITNAIIFTGDLFENNLDALTTRKIYEEYHALRFLRDYLTKYYLDWFKS